MTEETPSLNTELEPGYQLGEYRLENKLGEGGFGAVYRAVHPLIGKTAAVKVLHRQFSSNPEMVARFVAEAKAVNQIRQRNIIDIFSFGALPDGRQYYIMELLEGMPFDEYLDRHQPLSPELAIPILRQIAKALDAAHSSGIAHRDLKPENIFLVIDADGVIFPKLLDFGIAKLLHTDDQNGSVKTRTGTPMGTPYYMSPEQCRGINVDHRTDIYSFGIMTFKVLTGHLPFNAETTVDLLFKHLSEAPPRPSQIFPSLPVPFDGPVLKMLEKDPQNRPSTVSAAVDGLLQAAVDAGISVSIPGVVLPSPSPSGPNPALAHARTISSPNAGMLPRSESSATQISPVPSSGRGPLMALIGGSMAVLLGGGFVLLKPTAVPASTAPSASVSPPAASESAAPPVASSAPVVASVVPVASAPVPDHIELTIQDAPPSTAVFLGALKLGVAPGPLKLKRGDSPLKLTFRAPGYAPHDVEFVPAASGSLEPKLTKLQGAKKSNPGTGVGDLERPY